MKTETAEQTAEIKLVTKPKIVHQLQLIGASVTQRLNDLNIANLVATEDTVKSLKELRADLNKELTNYEDQRKYIKGEIMNPFNEFETVYKVEISDKYKSAIDLLKDKIGTVENRIKADKRDAVKAYFDELCTAEKIDFIPFEKLGLEINLSTSEKAYKEKCSEFISKVLDDMNLIKTEEFQAEISAEYKTSLNVSLAITTVKNRKEAERIEAERIRQAEYQKRVREVIAAGMIYDEFAKVYLFEDEVMIADTFLRESTKDEYRKKLVECEEKIKAVKSASKPEEKGQAQTQMNFAEKKAAEPVGAPVVTEAKPEIVTASFKVTGTIQQLRALGQYMKDNKITYENI